LANSGADDPWLVLSLLVLLLLLLLLLNWLYPHPTCKGLFNHLNKKKGGEIKRKRSMPLLFSTPILPPYLSLVEAWAERVFVRLIFD
jgi:hypothetical protein